MTTEDDIFTFNGINAVTGDYLLPPLSAENVSLLARGEEFDATQLAAQKDRVETPQPFAVHDGVDPKNLAEAGWGVIFAYDEDPAVKEALNELLEHRKAKAINKKEQRYRVFDGSHGYRPGESGDAWLERHGVGPGPVNPDKMPYYLLIVGSPERIPSRFQSQLDIQHAVGRIHFADLAEYAQYARSVVEAETKNLKVARKAAFFGVEIPDDPSTKLSTEYLVRPLARTMTEEQWDWECQTYIGAGQATKTQLGRLLGGNKTPALLFAASHGMGYPYETQYEKQLLEYQGALICQDWPRFGVPVARDHFFAGEDLGHDASLWGLIAFFFACYGGGTPKYDEFAHIGRIKEKKDEVFTRATRTQIAPYAFQAKLPQRMLSHPKGGALAVVAHEDRAWGTSFYWGRAKGQWTVFRDALKRLMEGYPVGYCIEPFNERYAQLSVSLATTLEDIKFGATPNHYSLGCVDIST